METENASGSTISLIMEVEEIAPEEAPSDSDSIECSIMRSSNSKDGIKNVSEGPEMACSIKIGVNKPESNGRKCSEESKKDKSKTSKEDTFQATAVGRECVGVTTVSTATLSSSECAIKIQSSMPENKLVALGSGEVQNTASLEEKLSAMFEEDKDEFKPSDNSEDQSGPTLEEQLTELFQDKSEGDEIPSSTTVVVNSPVEDNLIAIFEEEDGGGKSLSNQVCIFESKSLRKEYIGSPDVGADKELPHGRSCSVLLEKNVNVSPKATKGLSEKKKFSLKRKISEKETEHQHFMKEMKEARVVLKKLKFPSSDVDITLNEVPNKDLENVTDLKPVGKNSSLSQNSMLKSDDKPNEFAPEVTHFENNTEKASALSTVAKTKHKDDGKIIIPIVSSSQQEIKKKKSFRLSNRNSTESSHSEKLKLKPEKQSMKTLQTLSNLEITKAKSNESSKVPLIVQSGPKVGTRKRGRPPINRSKETILPPKTEKRKPVKTITKVQEPALVSRVSERLQLKMMKTRSVRKKKLHGDKHEGSSVKLQKSSQKREHILKLHRTAISLAKKRKSTNFTTYGLARKRRLLNAVKTASTKRKQSSGPLVDMKQASAKNKGPTFKEDSIDSLPKVTIALTPVLLKNSGKLPKTTLNKARSIHSESDMNKKNTNVKISQFRAETNATDSIDEQKNTQKKSEHKVCKKVPLKGLMVTRSKRELGQDLIQQKKKGRLKTIHDAKVTSMKKIEDSAKTGNARMETGKKTMTACGVELRNNEGVMELLVEDVTNLTANDIKDRGTDKTTMPRMTTAACQKNSSTVDVPSGMTDAQKIVEMRKAIWNLETRIDRYKLRQQAEERMVVYLSNKLQFYENNKYVQALMHMLKDASPGPQQNQDAVFITDLLLGYCPENDNYEKES